MSEQKPTDILQVENLHSDEEHSCAFVSLRGRNEIAINHSSTTVYHVIAGEGVMHVGGVTYELKPGVIVKVPAGVPYYDEGFVDMEVFCTPPFNTDEVERVESTLEEALGQLRTSVGEQTGQPSSEVSNYELFKRYNQGEAKQWDPRVAETVRSFLNSIGVVNLRSLDD